MSRTRTRPTNSPLAAHHIPRVRPRRHRCHVAILPYGLLDATSAQCRLDVHLTLEGLSAAEWREGGDSNPRRDLTSLTRLAGGRFQPLSHLPVGGPVYVPVSYIHLTLPTIY